MKIISKIKNLFTQRERVAIASVIFYPNKIIVVTEDFATTGIRLTSTKLTILPVDTSNEILGQVLKKHFSLTAFNVKHPTDFKKHWK